MADPAHRKSTLKGAKLHKTLGEAPSLAQHKAADTLSERDYGAIADKPLRWLILGLDTITSDFAPPPPDLAAECAASLPAPPPIQPKRRQMRGSVQTETTKRRQSNSSPAQAPKAAKQKTPKETGEVVCPSNRPALPAHGTPECTAARLLLCMDVVVKRIQRKKLQMNLQAMAETLRPAPVLRKPCKKKDQVQSKTREERPRTPDVLRDASQKGLVLQPWHSQVWRRRELRDQIHDEQGSVAGSGSPAANVAAVAKGACSKNPWAHAARSQMLKRASEGCILPPVRDAANLKKYERGTPALGAGFRVLAGFRAGSPAGSPLKAASQSPSQLRLLNTVHGYRSSPDSLAASQPRLLTHEGAIALMKDAGAWPRSSPSSPSLKKLAGSKSAGYLPPLGDSPHGSLKEILTEAQDLPTENSLEFAQASTELGTDLGELSAELAGTVHPDDMGDLVEDESCMVMPSAQYINPLLVFPQLARRPPMPARRIFFTDPESDAFEDQTRDPVDDLDVHLPAPSVTPSTVESLSDFHFLMASVMRGCEKLSMRKPNESSSELRGTLNLAAAGLKESLDEVSDDEESSFRHPPRWTRNQAILKTSGARDFGALAPCRYPNMETDTHEVASTAQWAFMSSCLEAKALPAVPRAIMRAIATKSPQSSPTAASAEEMAMVRTGSSPSVTSEPERGGVQLNLSNHNMGDDGLRALGATLPKLGHIESLNIACIGVSCKAMRGFLDGQMPNMASSLKALDLSRNHLVGEGTIRTFIDLLENGQIRALEVLNISSVDIPEKLYVDFLDALLGAGTLLSLAIADTRLGFKEACGPQASVEAVAKLISQGLLTELDMSGNFVRKEGAQKLAQALESTETLTSLDFSYNAGDHLGAPAKMPPPKLEEPEDESEPPEAEVDDPPFAPVLCIIEGVLRNTSLHQLSLSHCSLDYSADFMLAEAMLHHPFLSELDLSSNPHGALGLSCLLRATAVSHSNVRLLDVTDVRSAEVSRFAVKFNFRDPSGAYTLRLSHPQHRSVLRTLLDRPSQEGKDTKSCFQEASYESGSLKPGAKPGSWSAMTAPQDAKGIYDVPSEGVLRFRYAAPMPTTPRGDQHPTAKAQDAHRRGLIHVGFERCQVLAEAFGACRTEKQISLFLEGVCACLMLKSAHLKLFLQQAPATEHIQVVQRLAPSVGDRGEMLELAQVLSTAGERARIRSELRNLALLNLRNPTDHYHLRLANVCDHVAAQRLQVLAAFETALQRASGRPDVSQHGNYGPIRNAQHNGRSFAALPPMFDKDGVLEFDYASVVKMRKGTPEMPEDILESICSSVRHSKASWPDALKAFRSIADRFAMYACDVRQVIATFVELAEAQEYEQELRRKSSKRPPPRAPRAMSVHVEALVACFGRCSEPCELASKDFIYDMKFFTPEECLELRRRLGSVLVYDWANCHDADSNMPSGNNYDLDLSVNDQRLVAKYLLAVAKQEGYQHVGEPELDGDPLPDAVPLEKEVSWVDQWLAAFPESGVFRFAWMPDPPPEEVDSDSPPAAKPKSAGKGNPRRELAQQLLGLDSTQPAVKPRPASE